MNSRGEYEELDDDDCFLDANGKYRKKGGEYDHERISLDFDSEEELERAINFDFTLLGGDSDEMNMEFATSEEMSDDSEEINYYYDQDSEEEQEESVVVQESPKNTAYKSASKMGTAKKSASKGISHNSNTSGFK